MSSRVFELEPQSSPQISLYQRAVLGVLGLLALACGGLAVAGWRAVDAFVKQEAEERRDLKSFHAQLVEEVRGVAEKSGMLTSADLCPVRFRFRLAENAIHAPARPVRAVLRRVAGSATGMDCGTNGAGVAEFGLQPPGEYVLTATQADGYRLEHRFSVAPGVPVDRLVLCPYASDTAFETPVQVDWPETVRDGLCAVCEVERDDVRVGEWTWTPADRGRLKIVASPGAGDEADVADRLERWGAFGTDLRTRVPYRYSRLAGLTVCRLAEDDGGAPSAVATWCWSGGDEGCEGAAGTAGVASAEDAVAVAGTRRVPRVEAFASLAMLAGDVTRSVPATSSGACARGEDGCRRGVELGAPPPCHDAEPNPPYGTWVVALPEQVEIELARVFARVATESACGGPVSSLVEESPGGRFARPGRLTGEHTRAPYRAEEEQR